MNCSTPGLAPSGELGPRPCYRTIVRAKANNVCPGHFSARSHRLETRAPKLSFSADVSQKVYSASRCITLEFCCFVSQACLCRSTWNFYTMLKSHFTYPVFTLLPLKMYLGVKFAIFWLFWLCAFRPNIRYVRFVFKLWLSIFRVCSLLFELANNICGPKFSIFG